MTAPHGLSWGVGICLDFFLPFFNRCKKTAVIEAAIVQGVTQKPRQIGVIDQPKTVPTEDTKRTNKHLSGVHPG